MRRGGERLRGLSQWVPLDTGTKINFGDLTPYLTYAFRVSLLSSSFFVHSTENIFRQWRKSTSTFLLHETMKRTKENSHSIRLGPRRLLRCQSHEDSIIGNEHNINLISNRWNRFCLFLDACQYFNFQCQRIPPLLTRDRIQRKAWCTGPYAGVDFRVDSNTWTMRNPKPELTLSPSQGLTILPLYRGRRE